MAAIESSSIDALQAQIEEIEAQLQEFTPADWVPGSEFEYRFSANGDLELMSLKGYWVKIRGCNAWDLDEFNEHYMELKALYQVICDEHDEQPNPSFLYTTNERFKFLCDSVLELSGFTKQDWSPRQIYWLLFSRIELIEGTRYFITPPVMVLNAIEPPTWVLPTANGPKISKRAEMVASLVGACNGNIADAFELAMNKKIPARELMIATDALGYFSMDTKGRHEMDVKKWAAGIRSETNKRNAPVATKQNSSSKQPSQGNDDIPPDKSPPDSTLQKVNTEPVSMGRPKARIGRVSPNTNTVKKSKRKTAKMQDNNTPEANNNSSDNAGAN